MVGDEGARWRRSRVWFAVNAVVAWMGVLLQLVLSIGGFYPSTETVASRLGYANPDGLAGAVGRTMDYLSYFTIWSNILVAVVVTVLIRRPSSGSVDADGVRDTPLLRVLRLDSLLMITITGLVYAVVLAPSSHLQGWQVVGNFFVHQATPVLTVVVWLIAGPRAWIRWSTFLPAMVIPVIWVGWTLLRGTVIDAYPYPFVDVVAHGYGTVLLNLLGVVALAFVVFCVLLGIDRLLGRGRTRAAAATR
jgi:hypothetical protein